jgi:hypothetical protein
MRKNGKQENAKKKGKTNKIEGRKEEGTKGKEGKRTKGGKEPEEMAYDALPRLLRCHFAADNVHVITGQPRQLHWWPDIRNVLPNSEPV